MFCIFAFCHHCFFGCGPRNSPQGSISISCLNVICLLWVLALKGPIISEFWGNVYLLIIHPQLYVILSGHPWFLLFCFLGWQWWFWHSSSLIFFGSGGSNYCCTLVLYLSYFVKPCVCVCVYCGRIKVDIFRFIKYSCIQETFKRNLISWWHYIFFTQE